MRIKFTLFFILLVPQWILYIPFQCDDFCVVLRLRIESSAAIQRTRIVGGEEMQLTNFTWEELFDVIP